MGNLNVHQCMKGGACLPAPCLVCSPLLASLQPLVLGKLTEIYLDGGPGYHLICILKTREIPTAIFPVTSTNLRSENAFILCIFKADF